MYKFKKIIFDLLPFGLIRNIQAKRYPNKSILINYQNLPDISDCCSKFKHVVSVQGTGFSGSGAIVDLLREYSCCLTLGSVDKEGSKTVGPMTNGEIDFLRHSGGLFEIEHYLDDNNLFTKDALIKRFEKMVNSNAFFKHNQIKILTCQFYNQLIALEIDTKGHSDYNSHLLNPLYPNTNIKVMRFFSLSKYRDLCRRYVTSVFNVFGRDGIDYLVLDQLCGDFNYDNDRNLQYIPNLKTIFVFRDPRDTYTYAVSKDIPWIPHDTVDKYILWYKMNLRKLDFASEDYLIIRFEDLVLNYDKNVKIVEEYLELTEKKHTKKKENFAPSESIRNISIWKTLEGHQCELDKIKEKLPEFCYNCDE